MAELLNRSVQTLQETLRSKSPHRGSQAANIAEDLYTFTIERITDTELAYCSSVLFNTESGILKFMRDAAGMEEFAGCKEKLLDLLDAYVKMLGEKVIRYAPDIKDACFTLFARDKSSQVKKSTFPPLISVLELCVGTPTAKILDVAKMAEKYFQACLQPTKHTSTVRGCIFHILGTLCEVYPEQMVPYSDRLVDIYVKALKAETSSKKPEMPVIGGALRGLASYLTNFSHSAAEGSAYAQDIFKYMYKVIDPQISHSRYEVPRAGLLLLAKHAAQFKEYLARNHEQLYEYLVTWCSHNNRETKEVAIRAFDAFLQQVSVHITENAVKDRQTNADIFKAFIVRFRKIMDNQTSGHKELSMAIQGYGYFAAPCKLFMKPEDIQFMFGELVQRSEQLFFSTNETSDGRLFQLPTFLLALASIVKEIDELSESSLACLEKLAILLFECYPFIPPVNRQATYSSLLRLVLGVSNDVAVLKAFLSRVVYQGVIRTCSHPVVIGVGDGTAAVAVEDVSQEKMASYKDYIDLWSYLMDPSEIKGLSLQQYNLEQLRFIHQLIYDEFIRSVLRIVNKLDFVLVSATTPLEDAKPPEAKPSPDVKPPDDGAPTSDPVAGVQPSVPRDLQVFINLVDLCRDLFTKVHQESFRSWVYTFGHEVIVYSSKHPVISGFYKLLSTCLVICKKLEFFKGIHDVSAMEMDDSDRHVCFILVKKFLKEVLVRMKQYKGELLASCLQLLLSLPIELVTEEIGDLVPAVQVTLKLGLSYLPLANAGLDALEAWTSQLPPGLLQPHLQQILPNMDAYLRTQGTSMADENGRTVVQTPSGRGARMTVKLLAKWKEGMEGVESPQGKLLQRIVQFLGILGGQANTCLVKSESAAAYAARAVAWDSKKKLEFALPFQDMKPSIYLDPFLPRVCELAVSSSDRQSKVVACELLHAMVLFMIGRSAQPLQAQKNPMTKLYKKVFPYLLQLACDVERVAEQLFRPFVFQIIHWFTKNTQYESPDTIVLLESILDGIVSPTDTALRDFCALCIKEFLHWSIKQTTTTQQESSRINTKSLLKRLYSLSSHPSASKRLGAALAFNSIYTVFREEDSLVDTFAMEMLVMSVNSLKLAHKDDSSLGTQEQTSLVLEHLARIMKVKASLLIKPPSKSRRVPKGLKTAEMQNLVNWLLLQCGSPETECRDQCIKLFTQLTSVLPKTPNVRTWIRRTIESEGGSFFIARFEKGGHGMNVIQKQPILTGVSFTLVDCVGWMEGLAAALDCYNWVFREQFIIPSEVFQLVPSQGTEKTSNLFRSVQFFLESLALGGIEAAALCFDSSVTSVHTPLEIEEYNRAKCDLVLRLFRFLGNLVNYHSKEAISCVPKSFWSSKLFQLVVSCAIHPHTVGFNLGDVGTMDRVPKEVLGVLKAMSTHLQAEAELWNVLMDQIVSEIAFGGTWDLISKLPLVIGGSKRSTNIPPHLDALVKGHILLQKAQLLAPALAKTGTDERTVVQKLLDSVLSSVNCLAKTSHLEQGTVSPADELAAAQLLELALEIGVPSARLVDCLLHQTDKEGNVGLLLYQTFSQTLNLYLVTDMKFFSLMMQMSCKTAESVSGILGGILDYVAKDKSLKRQYGSQLCSTILSQWTSMSSWWTGGNNEYQLAAVSLLKRLLILEPKALLQASPAEQEAVVNMYVALLEDKAPLSFKSKVMELLQYFAALPEAHLLKLKGGLTKMVAYQFPLKSSELVPGTPHYIDYISVLDKLLNAMVASGCPVLLDVLMSVLCREQRHAHEDYIQNSLIMLARKYMFSASTCKFIGLAYSIFVNERDYHAEARRAAAEKVCLTMMRHCSEVALKEFFADHICQMMSVVEEKLNKSTLESQLVSKLCCFQFLEVLFSRLSLPLVGSMESKINQQYCKGDPKTGKELTQAVTKAGHEAKSEDLHGDKTLYELRRQYHCAAYNMLLAVISCTQNKLQFYTGFLFKEEPSKGQFLWENLVDCDREYHFEAELDIPIDRKSQMTAIRDEVRALSTKDSSPGAASPPFPRRYLSSQYLADSSLGADISQYDFSTGAQAYPVVATSPSSDAKETPFFMSEEKVEQDALNTHECMLTLMKLLDHLEHNKINPEVPKGTVPAEMPSWMAAIHKKMTEGRTHRNVRLFLTRLIINRPKVFQPYAKFWLPVLAQLVLSGEHGGEGLHYFVIDVVVTMLSWSTTAILEDRQLASSLLEYLMEHAHHENRGVFRNNLEVIKSLTECWKDKLQPPTKVIYDYFSSTGEDSKTANRTGIQLLGIVVANQMLPYDPLTAKGIDERKFYMAFCSLMSHKYKEVHAAAAEVLGMVLAFKEERRDGSIGLLQDLVSDHLTTLMATRSEDKALICLQKIQLNYPKLTERFVDKLIFQLPMLQGVFKTMCLEVLLSQADVRPQFYLELRDKGFRDMLSHRDEPTQLACLAIVQKMLRNLSNEQMTELLPLITAFGSHGSLECRVAMYDILIWMYNHYFSHSPDDGEGMDDGGSDKKELLAAVRDQLLQGLADDAESIRLKMFDFWNQESRLASDTLGRLTQLLAVLYSTSTERHFLHNSTNLLLELTSRSPDFTRSIFDQPLSECKFQDKSIDLSWQQRHLQMTPLFAATLASQTGMTQQDEAAPEPAEGGGIRATQQAGLAFTPTQEAGGYTWMAPSAQTQGASFTVGSVGTSQDPSEAQQQSSSLLFRMPKNPLRRTLKPVEEGFGQATLKAYDSLPTDPQEAQRTEMLKLKRRFVRDRNITSAFFAKTEAKKKVLREEQRHRQRAARDSKVVMYRKYREGELPDIQIKHAEIIRPFQALAQKDTSLARMLFASLYEAIFKQLESIVTERDAEAIVTAVCEGLDAVLKSSSQFYPPLIGSLEDVCFSVKQLSIDSSAAATASLMSKQEPIGIMLLEKQISGSPGDTEAPSAKRAKGNVPSAATVTWVELARLYKALGDFDVLHGIFSSRVGTKSITKEAMEAEERADYAEAVRQYKDAIGCDSWSDGPPMQVEEDLWEDSLLQCCNSLTEWGDLEKAAIVNIDDSNPPCLDKIWEDTYYLEHNLPYIMRAKLKLACGGANDDRFSAFLDKALESPERRGLLHARYPTELTLYHILKDDLDKARYFAGACVQSFLQEWPNLSMLLEKSRAAYLKQLQALAEMREYLDFMSSTKNFESVGPVEQLLSRWRSTFPHPKLDPISVWDDVVTNRCMMMRKMMQRFHNSGAGGTSSADQMEVDGTGEGVSLSMLQQLFSREYIQLYLRIASTATAQSNYAVARRYLQLTEKAAIEHFAHDPTLKIQWIHGVASMRIQQSQQDPSPTKLEPNIPLLEQLESYGKGSLDSASNSLACHHWLLEGTLYDIMANAFLEDGTLILGTLPDSKMKQLNTLIGEPSASRPKPEDVARRLFLKALSSLKGGVKAGTEHHKVSQDGSPMVKALVAMAKFCDAALRSKEEGVDVLLDTKQFPSVVVSYTLKAMQYQSQSATQQFPRLLQIVEQYPESLDAFLKKACDVPNWMFIGWISQMVALMDKPAGSAVHKILLSIANDYPQALAYPFRISSSDFKFGSSETDRANRDTVDQVKRKLENTVINDFILALEQLSSPELVWKDAVDNDLKPLMEQSVGSRDEAKLKEVWQRIYSHLFDHKSWETSQDGSLYGTPSASSNLVGARKKKFAQDYVKQVEDKFGKDGSKLLRMKGADFNKVSGEIYGAMQASLAKAMGDSLLKNYSPWLHNFDPTSVGHAIEVPGQYDGKSKPLPEYHVKIAGFDEKVLVMSSIRKPKRITIRGDDEKEYKFLVKGGEDLRLDQRIEQLFDIMNGILLEDAACSQRGLSLKTYSVIPMTHRVGLIGWVENTIPLKDFLKNALTESEEKHYMNGANWHEEWLKKFNSDRTKAYKEMYKKAKRVEVEKEFRRKATSVPHDLLRRAFMHLAVSPEAFLALRSHFINTYATLSICHYVLGIGDRHLSNYMVDLETGGVVGIDFGHAFGTATQFLPFPELMPFRLTPQITNLLLPHLYESGQLRNCMVHTMRALRNYHNLVLNTMDVFVKEPSLEWKSNARKQAKEQKLSEDDLSQLDVEWYPKEKVQQAKKKLIGGNPVYIMRFDLEKGHSRTPEYSALKTILTGDPTYNKRAKVGERCSSVEEQVDCLIDHATDPNILGRTWDVMHFSMSPLFSIKKNTFISEI